MPILKILSNVDTNLTSNCEQIIDILSLSKKFCFDISAIVNMKFKNNYEINFKNL